MLRHGWRWRAAPRRRWRGWLHYWGMPIHSLPQSRTVRIKTVLTAIRPVVDGMERPTRRTRARRVHAINQLVSGIFTSSATKGSLYAAHSTRRLSTPSQRCPTPACATHALAAPRCHGLAQPLRHHGRRRAGHPRAGPRRRAARRRAVVSAREDDGPLSGSGGVMRHLKLALNDVRYGRTGAARSCRVRPARRAHPGRIEAKRSGWVRAKDHARHYREKMVKVEAKRKRRAAQQRMIWLASKKS